MAFTATSTTTEARSSQSSHAGGNNQRVSHEAHTYSLSSLWPNSVESQSLSDLPDEMILEIFAFLSYQELTRNSSVSKQWNRVSYHNVLWEPFCRKHFPRIYEKKWVSAYAEEKKWRDVYKLLCGINLPKRISRLDFARISIEGDIIARAAIYGGIEVWSLSTGKKLYTIRRYRAKAPNILPLLMLGFCKFFTYPIMRGNLSRIKYFKNTEEGTRLYHAQKDLSLAIKQNRLVSTFSAEGSKGKVKHIGIWKARTGRLLQSFIGHNDAILSLDIENEYVVGGCSDGKVKLWNALTGNCVKTFSDHVGAVRSVIIKDGRILSGGEDGTIRIWDLTTYECLAILDDGQGFINSIAFDGTYIVSGGFDRRARVWDINSRECIRILGAHEDAIQKVIIQNNHVISMDSHTWGSDTFDKHHIIISSEGIVLRTMRPAESLAGVNRNVYLWDITTGKCLKEYSVNPSGREIAMQGKVLFIGHSILVLSKDQATFLTKILQALF